MIVGAACVIVGAISSYFLSKKLVTKENLLKLVGAFGAGFVCFLVTSGIEMPTYAKYGCIVVAGILGMFLIRGSENMIFAYGTGFMGAFFMMHGLGQYLGGFPPLSNP